MSPEQLSGVLPFVLIAAVFWFLVIRPARKRQQELARIQASIRSGSQVMLSSGIYGTVSDVSDDTVRLEVAPGVAMRVARQAVARVVDDVPAGPSGRTEPVTSRSDAGSDDK